MGKNRAKFLHLFPLEKFTEDFINFVNDNFDAKDHLFLVFGKYQNVNVEHKENVRKIPNNLGGKFFLLKEINKYDHVFLHGLYSNLLILSLQPWLLKKYNWVVWGTDLYYYQLREKTIKENLREFARRFIIKRIGSLTTNIKEEHELAKKWYGFDGKYFKSILYPSNIFNESNYNFPSTKKEGQETRIQVGHSSFHTNNHLEIFEKLKKYKNQNIKIVCPLSYGDYNYRKEVISNGFKIFGDRFDPVTEEMSLPEYYRFLAGNDIAIFNYKLHEAMSNTINLLGLGKKVYIRDDSLIWNLFDRYGIETYKSNRDFNDLLEKIPEDVRIKNSKIIKKNFSKETLLKEWKDIFNGKNEI